VVIVGGGFARLYAARGLAGAPVEVTLVDRRNFHLFQPLAYQVSLAATLAQRLQGRRRREGPARRRFPAWVLWLVVHLFYLIGFQNRLLVLLRWTVSFATHGRGARLITERA
jgi:NADH dehydrogenase FAD-containing subunit